MKFLVIGAGRMGRAIAYDLLAAPGVEAVTLVDRERSFVDSAREWLGKTRAGYVKKLVTTTLDARDTGAAHRLVEVARDLGLIVDAENPILRIDACPGAPACRSSSVDTRRTARLLAASAFTGSAHVSGCAKGCACPGKADVMVTAQKDGYNLAFNASADAAPVYHSLSANAILQQLENTL